MRPLSLSLIALLSACNYYVPLSNPQTQTQVVQQSLAKEKPCPQPIEKIIETTACPQKVEEQPERKNPINPEYRALLDTLAWAEGTGCYYNMMLGGGLFLNFSSHPVETGEMPAKGFPFREKYRYKGRSYWRINSSTAAGRYQYLYWHYLQLKEKGFFQNGFTPEEQDKTALYLIKEQQGVTEEMLNTAVQAKNTTLQSKNFLEVWNTLSWEWASIPCDESHKPKKDRKRCYKGRGRYNQKAREFEDLQRVFFYHYKLYKQKEAK